MLKVFLCLEYENSKVALNNETASVTVIFYCFP